MEREDVKDLTLSVLAIVAVVLVADCVFLHMKCARQADELANLSLHLEQHINPPQPPQGQTLSDKAKQAYGKLKSAAAKGYKAAKEELGK